MLQSRQQKKPAQDQHSTADKEVKKGCKQEKRNYVKELAQEAENACSKEDIRTLYSITRQLSGKLTSTNAPIRDPIGKILTKTEDQLARWRDHLKQLLNRLSLVDPPELDEGPTLNIKTNAITKAEVVKAIKNL